ncbi:hypothetical protein AMELA_G00125270 [Ameiurus melas]|uniref:Uncharacterized protein n=1 Tax=Ameiurus melas TaxID=219545 RepID=A0A7J6AMP8_AMEME|nr:hypothetical protein AMELA_G00125270 [Ameiurus melas]
MVLLVAALPVSSVAELLTDNNTPRLHMTVTLALTRDSAGLLTSFRSYKSSSETTSLLIHPPFDTHWSTCTRRTSPLRPCRDICDVHDSEDAERSDVT